MAAPAPDLAAVERDRRTAMVALLAVAALLAAAARPPAALPAAPARRSLASAQPWMADALPGIGPKRRQDAAQALRRGDLRALPAASRAGVPKLFATAEAAAPEPSSDHPDP